MQGHVIQVRGSVYLLHHCLNSDCIPPTCEDNIQDQTHLYSYTPKRGQRVFQGEGITFLEPLSIANWEQIHQKNKREASSQLARNRIVMGKWGHECIGANSADCI